LGDGLFRQGDRVASRSTASVEAAAPGARRRRLALSLARDLAVGGLLVLLVAGVELLAARWPALAPLTRGLRAAEDAASDFVMPFHRGVVTDESRVEALVLVDIDDATHHAWGRPVRTPRDKLADILAHVAAGRPRAIVVDIDLSNRSLPVEADERLAATLAMLGREGPPVLLARDRLAVNDDPACAGRYQQLKPSFLEPVVDAAPGHLFWVTPLYERDDDLTVRRWRLAEQVCDDGQVRLVPSVQLLVHALLRDLGALEQLRRTWGGGEAAEAAPTILFLGRAVPLRDPGVRTRLVYKLPWPEPAAAAETAAAPSSLPGRPQKTVDGRRVDLLTILSAAAITEADARDRAPVELFTDRIVLIGGSYTEARDMHRTPIGPMPGAMMILNAVHAILEHGVLEPPRGPQRLVPALLLIVVVSLLFNFLQSTVASLASLALVTAAGVWLNVTWLDQGVWLDAALPAYALAMFKWFLSATGIVELGKLGWWAFVHPRWHPQSRGDEPDEEAVAAIEDEIESRGTR
jgi:CHASE2 domain-containing sensor protein